MCCGVVPTFAGLVKHAAPRTLTHNISFAGLRNARSRGSSTPYDASILLHLCALLTYGQATARKTLFGFSSRRCITRYIAYVTYDVSWRVSRDGERRRLASDISGDKRYVVVGVV